MIKNEKVNDDFEAREVADTELEDIVGGGAQGGPICPVCGSGNVTFDARLRKVLECKDCHYKA